MIFGQSFSGKSIIAQNIIARNAALPSIFFSLEMPASQALTRLYAMTAGANATDVQLAIEKGEPPAEIWELAEQYPQHKIIDKPALTLGDMSHEVEVFEEEHKTRPEFIVVDYLELIGGSKSQGEGFLGVDMIATSLKDWAKTEQMRVFVVHQANRIGAEWDPPTLRSARYGGITEADYVVGVWRPHLDPRLNDLERLRLKYVVCANILKNRAFGTTTLRVELELANSLRVGQWPNNERTTRVEHYQPDNGESIPEKPVDSRW